MGSTKECIKPEKRLQNNLCPFCPLKIKLLFEKYTALYPNKINHRNAVIFLLQGINSLSSVSARCVCPLVRDKQGKPRAPIVLWPLDEYFPSGF